MSLFATFETDMVRHAKFERIPEKCRAAAFAIHVAFILHSAELLTDGRVLRGNAMEICRFLGLSRPRKTLVSMEEVGLLSSDKTAFYVHDYGDFQPLREEVEDRRKRDAQRKRDARLGRHVRKDILEDVQPDVRAPHPHPHPPTSTNSSTSPQDPAAELEKLGWKPWQIEQGLRDPLRALAWSNASSTARNPGGWAWAGYIAGGSPATNSQEEKPKMNVVDACQRFIESIAWDKSFDEAAMREEFGRIQRKPRTEGALTQPELQGLLEQWAATRQDRHGIPANLGAA